MITKSELMSMYNKARASKSGKVNDGRVNRAFGLLQRKDQGWREKYSTTIEHCGCPDSKNNGGLICKHRLALMIEFRAIQRRNKLAAERDLSALALDAMTEKLRRKIWKDCPYGTYSRIRAETGWKNILEEKQILEKYLEGLNV